MPDNPYATATPATAPPSLGYGQQGKAPIDAVNQWMRSQPWYQALIRSFGQDPSNVHLNDSQKQQIVRAAQANGVVVDEGHNGQQVDDSGNFEPKSSSTLSKVLIVGGIAAAALATAGLAGVFGGAATGAAEGGTLASTALPATGALATGTVASGAVPAALAAGGAASGGAVLPAVVGAAGTAAASKIPSWLAPAIGIGGQLAGTAIAANASSSAADKQAAGVQAALDFEKQQYADITGRLAPYVAAGTSSTDRMAQLLGLPARSATTATAPPTRGPAVGNAPPPAPAQPTAAPTGGMVTLQAPDGTTKSVPSEQVPHYQALGAKVLGAAA